jgi:hypothetical protein
VKLLDLLNEQVENLESLKLGQPQVLIEELSERVWSLWHDSDLEFEFGPFLPHQGGVQVGAHYFVWFYKLVWKLVIYFFKLIIESRLNLYRELLGHS